MKILKITMKKQILIVNKMMKMKVMIQLNFFLNLKILR